LKFEGPLNKLRNELEGKNFHFRGISEYKDKDYLEAFAYFFLWYGKYVIGQNNIGDFAKIVIGVCM